MVTNTDLSALTMHYTVNTVHGDRLEWVLDQACDRTGKDYYERLVDIVTFELGRLPFPVEFWKWDAYYRVFIDVHITNVDTTTLDNISQIRPAMDRAVRVWDNKYNVSRMLKYEEST
jgi:hypothetical protein